MGVISVTGTRRTDLPAAMRRARLDAEMTLEEAGAAIGVNQTTPGNIERGRTADPAFSIVAGLAAAYGVNLSDLAVNAGFPIAHTPSLWAKRLGVADEQLRYIVAQLAASTDAEWVVNLIARFHAEVQRQVGGDQAQ